VSKDRLSLDDMDDGFLELAPDLVVEVVSQNDSASYMQDKIEMWLEAGARLVWIVYPELQSVVVYDSLDEAKVLHVGDDLEGIPVFEDFNIAVEEIFK
jgi:Uma2 family endonuclease